MIKNNQNSDSTPFSKGASAVPRGSTLKRFADRFGLPPNLADKAHWFL